MLVFNSNFDVLPGHLFCEIMNSVIVYCGVALPCVTTDKIVSYMYM